MNEKGLPLEKKLSLGNVINEPSETSSTDYINKLPCECLARIFMYLDIFDRIEIRKSKLLSCKNYFVLFILMKYYFCFLVCKNWKDICDNFAWYDIKKFVCHASIGRSYNNRKMKTSDVATVLFRCGRYLRHLILSVAIEPSILSFVVAFCKNLTHLEIKLENIYHENYFNDAFIQLTSLRSIKIEYCRENALQPDFPTQVLDNLSEEIDEITLFIFECQPHEPLYNPFHPVSYINSCINKKIITQL